MKSAVQFGAGNIGRGFTGELFSEAGFEVVFIDVVPDVVEALNTRHSYNITIAKEPEELVPVHNVRAVNGRDADAVAAELVACEVACTAVGVNVLGTIANPIAKGISQRMTARPDDTLNFIVCENMLDAAGALKTMVYEKLDNSVKSWADSHIGFAQAVVGRMVPVRTAEEKAEDVLGVRVEPFKMLPVDKDALVGSFPEIAGIVPKSNYQAYIDQKLFAHNMSHAAASYFGYLKGLTYIWECMEDEEVERKTRQCMNETSAALMKRYDLDKEHFEELLQRFHNKKLGDTVARVGADPVRKLGREDRLVGAALFCLEEGIQPEYVVKAIAAGLHFAVPEDKAACEVQSLISAKGPEAAIETVCGLDPASELGRQILEEYRAL